VFKVGTTIFADYTNQKSSHMTSFNVSRAYNNVTGQLNKRLSFRVTPDIARETGSGSSLTGSQEYRLKYAFGQLNLDEWTTKGSFVRVGIQQTPYIDDQESAYKYRFQGSVYAEREGYLVSSDAGVSARYAFPGSRGDVHAGIYNGEGYNKSEVNGKKAFQVRGSFRPFAGKGALNGLRFAAFVDADHYAESAKKQRVIGQVTFESANFRAGVDRIQAHDRTTATAREVSGSGWSAWAAPRIYGPWELLLRHDDTRPDGATSQHRTRNIAGVAYWLTIPKATTAILVDYDSLTQSGYSTPRPRDTRYGLKMLVSF
jgi:hypothetical protein